ncbi:MULTISPECIES: hypothetical protein [unclassified Fibrobacter]|uniref:hypothetical protein n=1 Tax=unclassified Fibrobacter TaxID=2634177 RepID=UPI0011825EEB|nr:MULTISPECIES: hypothetical protein [unclassified Fibrobacter]
MAFALTACVGNAPAPETNPQPEQADNTDVSQPQTGTSSEANQIVESQDVYFNSQALDNHRLATPDNIPSATPVNTPNTDATAKTDVADPYTTIPAIVQNIFDYADALYKAGYTDSATAYLERFRVIKPLWAQWETKADSMLNEFGKTRAEKAKAYEPMVFQIQNMNRANSDYGLVAETADSLIALAPGDSLTQWAKAQKGVAYKNTLTKAKKEYAAIKDLADNQAQFAEAEKRALTLQMRYRDFEDVLHLQELIDHIRELMQLTNAEATKYWESHDPAQALAQADTLLQKEKFSEAKELLNKLKASKLRKEANELYTKLADNFCTKQRKTTSQMFAKAQKQKDAAKKKKLLNEAIAPLDKCLTEYPDNPQKQKVEENKKFLEQELGK